MATKVKGESIKEGSIPLSALNDEVQDKINSGGGANWNAAEGEVGYIKNRTHYLYNKSEHTLGKGINKINYTYRKFILFNDIIQVLPEFEKDLEIKIVSGPPVSLKYNVENTGQQVIELIDVTNYFGHNTIEFYTGVKPINNVYLPDTVIKTTPQQLSDDDKNQALTNLGIDPVVWKYICNPLIIQNGENVPEELIGEYSDNVGYEGGYFLKYPNLAMYKIMITDNRIDTEFGDGASVIITPSDINECGLGIQDIYISKDYGVYAGGANIDKNKNWEIQ